MEGPGQEEMEGPGSVGTVTARILVDTAFAWAHQCEIAQITTADFTRVVVAYEMDTRVSQRFSMRFSRTSRISLMSRTMRSTA